MTVYTLRSLLEWYPLYFNEQIAKRFIPNPRFMSLGKAIELWLENMNPPPAILVDNETCTEYLFRVFAKFGDGDHVMLVLRGRSTCSRIVVEKWDPSVRREMTMTIQTLLDPRILEINTSAKCLRLLNQTIPCT